MTTSYVAPLRSPADGLLARLSLVNEAERTLDLQYYLWDSDVVGYLLLSRVLAAADLGVTVRLLVDDLRFRERTRSIASLCLHPNLEVRVFNPFRKRTSAASQGIEFIRRFAKLDHRMHNKLMVADDKAAVLGGRNIAAEHFGLAKDFNLVDADLMLTGDAAAPFSLVFESYWETPLAIQGMTLDESVSEADLDATRDMITSASDWELLRWRRPSLERIHGRSDSLRSDPWWTKKLSASCSMSHGSPTTRNQLKS